MDLTDRVALVTGGAGHVGGAICDALAELGASLVVLDLDGGRCRSTADKLTTTYGARAEPISIDLRDHEAVREVPTSIASMFGRLDILVNTAALVGTSELKGWTVPFEEQGADAWRLAQDVNLLAPFMLVQACAPLLRSSGAASVINVSSIYGLVGPDYGVYGDTGMANPAAYAASKGGLIQLTRWLATTLAPDIRVNAITPGGILRGQPDGFIRRYESRTPVGRLGREEDMKGAAAFLASDMSSYVTGHNLVVDGGWTAW
jgi:NAD(P)-dependent dehydrogenase (short-subunit alcohol dehydrogenase family)